MKVRECTKCGKRRPCAMAGPHGAWVCELCLYQENLAATKEEAS